MLELEPSLSTSTGLSAYLHSTRAAGSARTQRDDGLRERDEARLHDGQKVREEVHRIHQHREHDDLAEDDEDPHEVLPVC